MPASTSRWSISGLSPVTRTKASSPKRSTTSKKRPATSSSGPRCTVHAEPLAELRDRVVARVDRGGRPRRGRAARSAAAARRAAASVLRSPCSGRSTLPGSRAELMRAWETTATHQSERVQPAQPQLEVHELPEEHHVVLARLARADDLVVLVDQPAHLARRRRCRGRRKSERADQVVQQVAAVAREPGVGRRVPARLLDPRARLLRAGCPSSPCAAGASSRRPRIFSSPGTRNISSTRRWSKNGSQLRSPKAARLAVLGAQAAGRRLAVHVLVGAVLQVARERRGPSPARTPRSRSRSGSSAAR